MNVSTLRRCMWHYWRIIREAGDSPFNLSAVEKQQLVTTDLTGDFSIRWGRHKENKSALTWSAINLSHIRYPANYSYSVESSEDCG